MKSMKKFWLVLSLAMFCLIVGSLWEYSLNDWSADKKLPHHLLGQLIVTHHAGENGPLHTQALRLAPL